MNLPKDGAARGSPQEPLVLIPVSAEDVIRRRRRMALFAIFAIALCVGGVSIAFKRSVNPLYAQQSYDSGVRLLRIAHYNQAALAFDRAVGLKPDFAEAYLMRGKAYAGDSRTDAAIRDFSQVIELRPGDPRAWIARGTAFLDLKKFSLALEDASRAVELDARLAPAYNLRGLAVRALGDRARALADFTRAVELEPNEDNYYQRAATFQMLDDHAHAIADLDRVIALRPDAPLAYFARAESRRAIGDFEGALADQRRADELEGR